MILQSWYQRRRHYVSTSLGKAKDIDLVDTETIVEKPTDLIILVPLLFLTYVSISNYQFYLYKQVMIREFYSGMCHEFECVSV